MAAGAESKRRPAESLEALAELFAEGGAEGGAGLSREANNERAVTGTGVAMVGALTPRTRLKPRGGFSFLPLQRRIQQLDVLKERPLTDLSNCFKRRVSRHRCVAERGGGQSHHRSRESDATRQISI